MAGTKIRMKAQKQADFSQIHWKLHAIEGLELVAKSENTHNGVAFWLLVYEKYYFRTGSYASVTILLTEYGSEQFAEVISSGGGGGIVNHSYGANRKLAVSCIPVLESFGFTVVESDLDTKSGILDRLLK